MYGAVPPGKADSGAGGEAQAVLRQLGVPLAEAEKFIKMACSELGSGAGTSAIVKRAMGIRSRK